ncbi:FAD-containing monooxygenase EthA [Winogradskyella sp. PC-19]|uniref:flavin-containing monooxygenase n=1 Tax=unclassified Winogradskyella TaxID=2615021 RepID=UPI000B3C7D16|nr:MULTISPECIES: NAD(P)/FAD-dependent oxidoreductase [unclassified Winogradskyella]ARV09803.1 FAD-containing monooxygenase EthA [Winogradskyella sp. PC-19]
MSSSHFDILIVGAGLSGIGAACHLQRKNPEKTYIILESRATFGGTWDLFKYPGIRSDSDMYTFGYSFKTWDNPKSYADAGSILTYLKEASEEYGVKDQITYHQKAISCNFNSKNALWTITTENVITKEEHTYTSKFIFNCSGYYNYDKGYTPEFKGLENFKGQFIHPQKWPENLNLKKKKVVVIGSGATAVTIVPKIADQVGQVTMLQRTPTYVSALPNKDKIAELLKKILPKTWAHKAIRTKNILLSIAFFNACRKWPNALRKFISKKAQKQLGDIPVNPHFTPNYEPWEQRFCIAPDGDLFKALIKKKASIVTAKISHFDENGIILESGEAIKTDIIVSATGLKILPLGGIKISIDGNPIDVSKTFVYRGAMLSGLPNLFLFVGYTNASWTLKSDLTSEYISRVIKYIDKHNLDTICPIVKDKNLKPTPLLNLNSGYINRAKNILPNQGDKAPWRVYQNYILDYKMLRIDRVNDGVAVFK